MLKAAVVLGIASSTQASLTLLSGPQQGTHVGNLVTNGSFEIGAPAVGAANKVYWATGTTSTPYSLPAGWSASGSGNNYAQWGSDNATPEIQGSAQLPDGTAALYFGNHAGALSSQPPAFNNDGTVSFPSPPTMTAPKGNPVQLWQTVPTNTNLAPSYLLSFWVSGEFSGLPAPVFPPGIFGLRVTNVLAGDPMQFLTVPGNVGILGNAHRFEYTMVPLNPLLPITVEFWNWGHFDLTPWGGPSFTTELVLDDVIVNMTPEPASLGLLAVGGLLLGRRRRAMN